MSAVRSRQVSARTQVAVSVALGLVTGLLVVAVATDRFGPLIGWDTAAAVYLVWVWVLIWPLDARQTAQRAEHQDPTRAAADLLLLSAAVVSLIAVGLVLAAAPRNGSLAEVAQVGLAVVSIALSWAIVHTVFTLRYAGLYYGGADGGIDFNQSQPPAYTDFAYLAFTIGMTFQVSDTDLQDTAIRRTALRHGLLSFVFGTGIVAATINLVASLGSGG
jgi:uncharacterized membrane protein